MLTDVQCRTAVPAARLRKLADAHGLYLAVTPAGGKTWCWKYRFGGREKKLTIGPYPAISIKAARAARDSGRAQLAAGIDPGLTKRAAKARARAGETFEQIARSWHKSKQGALTPRYAQHILRRLEANVFPWLGSMAIRDITPLLVLETLRRIEARGAVTMAHEVRGHMSEVFVWAISSALAETDPAAIVRKALTRVGSGRRAAVISIRDARTVALRIDQVKGAYWSTKLASRLLALTAVRPGVIRMAERAEFTDLDGPEPIWRIPAAKMKLSLERKMDAAFDFWVPLSHQAAATVRAAMAAGEHPRWLFPGERGVQPISDSTLSALYRDAGFTGTHVPHGWRATFSTIMNERAAGLDRDLDRAIIDFMLAHLPGGVEGAYNRAAYLSRRRQLAQEWADLLMQDMSPPDTVRTGPRRKG